MSLNSSFETAKSKKRRKRSKNNFDKNSLTPPTSMDHSLASGQARVSPPIAVGGRIETMGTTTTVSPQEVSPTVQEAATANGKVKKRRRRRAPRRRWKPYYKLTNEERRKLEVFEEKRAERIRALRFKHGLPVAPYNTTQFLLNDRQLRGNNDEPSNVDEIVENIRHHCGRSESYESGSDSCGVSHSSASDDGEFDMIEKEFDFEYESACAERLEAMSKSDLIKDYIDLEKQFEKCQRELTLKTQELSELRQRLSNVDDHNNKCTESSGQQRQQRTDVETEHMQNT